MRAYNNQITYSPMLEFTPFNPFAAYQLSSSEEDSELCSSSLYTQESHSSIDVEDYNIVEQTQTSSLAHSPKWKSKASEYHNMTKQLLITMKQIMSKYIKDIGSTHSKRAIIRSTWEKLTKMTRKLTLKLVFDSNVDAKLLKKEGLIDSVDSFNAEDFRLAMCELKDELIVRMKESVIRSNLIDRKIAKKDALFAYIHHFLHDELETGDIKARFGSNGSTQINKILNRTKREEDFISDFLI